MRDLDGRSVHRSLRSQSEGLDRRLYYLGIVLVIASILLHQPLLLVCGFLLLLVLCITDLWAYYCLKSLYYQRKLSESRVSFGEEVTLSLAVENAKLLPLPWLEVEDTIPRSLAIEGKSLQEGNLRANTATLDCLFNPHWYERITRRYTLHAVQRGVHAFGPTKLRSGDIFGFSNQELQLSNHQYLLVYPLIVPLTRFGIPSRHPFGERKAPRRLLEDPARVIGVREYMYGDSMRRVNWKATARMQQMQSKVYEATTTYTLILFLNAAAHMDTYYGIHPELQELAICAAASIASWAIEQGYAVGLHSNTNMYRPDELSEKTDSHEAGKQQSLQAALDAQLKRRRIHLPASSSADQLIRVLDVLARIQGYFGSNIEDVIMAERMRLPAGATVVIITSNISELLVDALTRVRQGGHAVAILFVGDTPPPLKLVGITIYHIGGEQAWKSLVTTFGSVGGGGSGDGEMEYPLEETIGISL